ncbi:AAA family ATPase [uncultured Modestobacter sp.]|uniref:AAA family ATPase n=1 Tax=uncultured Modestobacter sp. TaxID=380048 RepID=UPI002624201D|nr:AAA family ATPase [uncultured Modestobacter sp.]
MSGYGSSFSIRRVRLRHFKSIASCDVRLGPLAMLVGPNGSGKSNFLDALRLTSDALTTTLDHALRDRGGITEVRRRSTGHPTHFRIELDFVQGLLAGSFSFQVAAVSGGDYRISHEDCMIQSAEFGHTERHHYSTRNGKLASTSIREFPSVVDDRLSLVAISAVEPFRTLFDGLSALAMYSLNPDSMRKLQNPDSGEQLRRDGSNAASVIERLRRENPELKARIEEYLGQVVPGVDGVERISLGSWESLEFRQHVTGAKQPWSFAANSMSDGTLRALGVLLALFPAPSPVVSSVGIEEPEIALHPAAAGVLMGALRDASGNRQVLVTSHSPDLLDDPTIREDELLAVRSEAGETVIGRPDSAGRLAIADGLFTAGEMLRQDQLIPDKTRFELPLPTT